MRNGIVGQGPADELPRLVVVGVFEQGLPHRLRHAAVDLSFYQKRVDHHTAIVHGHVGQELHGTSVRIDFDDRHVCPKWIGAARPGTPATWTRPPVNTRSATDASKRLAARSKIFWRTTWAARNTADPPTTSVRLPAVPSPLGTAAVSPVITVI